MNNFLKDKGPKLWIFILVGIMCLGAVGGCAPGDDNIKGHFKYEQTIYINPASSYAGFFGEYIITDDSLTIIHFEGAKEQFAASFEKSEVDIEAFAALFPSWVEVPDISVFKKRYQYSINERYRLYLMDGEVWLAACANNMIWSIYRLTKIED